jgi:hypothetical protein
MRDGVEILRVTADEAATSRVRVGIFRLGFAERLLVRNAVIDVLVEPESRRERTTDFPDGLGLASAHGVTGIRVDGLRLRLHNANNESIEISADHAEVGIFGGARLAFSGHVRVQGEEVDARLAALTYDFNSGRLVDGKALRGTSLRGLNEALRSVGVPNIPRGSRRRCL